jgi:hypothetical protein
VLVLFYGIARFTRNEEVPKYVPQVLSKYVVEVFRIIYMIGRKCQDMSKISAWYIRAFFCPHSFSDHRIIIENCRWKENFAAFGRKVCRFLQRNTGKTGIRGSIRKINFAIIPDLGGKTLPRFGEY